MPTKRDRRVGPSEQASDVPLRPERGTPGSGPVSVGLSPPHIDRPRLLKTHVPPPVQLIVGPAGAGKTALIRELGARHNTEVIAALIDRRDMGADELLMRLRDGLARTGNREGADALMAPHDATTAVADAFIAHLRYRDDPLLIAVDGADLLDSQAMDLLGHIAANMPAPHSLVIAARRLDGGLGKLRLLTSMMVVDDELAFTVDEARTLFNGKLGLRLTPKTVQGLLAATNGSPWQLAVAGCWFASIEDVLDRQDAIDKVVTGSDAISLVVDHVVDNCGRRDRAALIRLASVAWADERIAAAASARTAVLDAIVAAGLGDHDGDRVRMAEQTRSLLRAKGAPLSGRAARRIAATFVDQGDLRRGVRTLIDHGLEDQAATTLVSQPPAALRQLGAGDLQALVDALPSDVIATHPRLLLLLARAWQSAGRPAERHQALQQATALGDRLPERLRVAFELERMADQAGTDAERDDRIRQRCAHLLETLDSSRHDVRARTLEVVASVELAGTHADRIDRASWCLATAVKAYLAGDDPYGAATARTRLAASVLLADHRLDDAIDELDMVIGDRQVERPLVAMALAHRARAHAGRGRLVRANADIEEAARLGRSLGNQPISGFVARVRREIATIDTTPQQGRVVAGSEPAEGLTDANVVIRVLDSFQVLVGGTPALPRRGLSTQLLKVLAVRGGHAHSREVARALWPDDDPSRTVQRLDSVRTNHGLDLEVTERDGDFLRLLPGVQVDATWFEQLAREAQAGGNGIDVVAARAALEHYGTLLPDDEAGWVVSSRQRLQQLAVRLIDGLIAEALERDDALEAGRWNRRGQTVAPADPRWSTYASQWNATDIQ